MNLSIPPSLVPDVIKRRKHLQKVTSALPEPTSVAVTSLPTKKKPQTHVVPDPNPKVVSIETPPDSKDPDFSRVRTAKDLNSFSVTALKKFCGEHKLSKTGRRSQLVQRVVDYIQSRDSTKKKKHHSTSSKKDKAPPPNTVELDLNELEDVDDVPQ